MADRYRHWTKARVRAGLRARGLPDRGATEVLRARLAEDDTLRARGRAERSEGAPLDAGAGEERDGRRAAATLPERLPPRALEELEAVTGRVIDRVVGLRSEDDGWSATIDVLEHSRVPPSSDLLTTYRVSFDRRWRLRECARTGAHVRARPLRRGSTP